MFKQANVGTIDRAIRIVVAIALASYAWMHPDGGWSIAAYVVAAVLALTALVRFCPAYTLLGVNTCPVGKLP